METNPAYPVTGPTQLISCKYSGLTKREHFAAMAMPALLSKHAYTEVAYKYAQEAVIFADALIEALNKPTPEKSKVERGR